MRLILLPAPLILRRYVLKPLSVDVQLQLVSSPAEPKTSAAAVTGAGHDALAWHLKQLSSHANNEHQISSSAPVTCRSYKAKCNCSSVEFHADHISSDDFALSLAAISSIIESFVSFNSDRSSGASSTQSLGASQVAASHFSNRFLASTHANVLEPTCAVVKTRIYPSIELDVCVPKIEVHFTHNVEDRHAVHDFEKSGWSGGDGSGSSLVVKCRSKVSLEGLRVVCSSVLGGDRCVSIQVESCFAVEDRVLPCGEVDSCQLFSCSIDSIEGSMREGVQTPESCIKVLVSDSLTGAWHIGVDIPNLQATCDACFVSLITSLVKLNASISAALSLSSSETSSSIAVPLAATVTCTSVRILCRTLQSGDDRAIVDQVVDHTSITHSIFLNISPGY
jgi:hypothetical protein